MRTEADLKQLYTQLERQADAYLAETVRSSVATRSEGRSDALDLDPVEPSVRLRRWPRIAGSRRFSTVEA